MSVGTVATGSGAGAEWACVDGRDVLVIMRVISWGVIDGVINRIRIQWSRW